MHEDEKYEIILKVVKRIANKHVFPHYGVEDIIQEGFIIGLEALKRYDNSRPLENFLAVHIRNRLLNLKRDKYYRPNSEIQERKKKLAEAACVEDIRTLIRASSLSEDIEFRELTSYIDSHLPSGLRADYRRFMSGAVLARKKRCGLIEVLKEILENYYA